jgi:FAD/FMN-containing dehydrogenase/Fe-S oxidoreductase
VAHSLRAGSADRSGVTPAAARALAAELRRELAGEVRFAPGDRAMYATDASNYRQVPIGVVLPRDAADVEATLAACRRFGAPVLGRGGGTSLAGQCCNVAVVLDFSKYMDRVVDLDPAARTATVQPGIRLDVLRAATEPHDLSFGPDPATHLSCTIGGMLGNNACGMHALYAGKTVDNVLAMDVLLYDGTRLRVGPTPDDELARIVAAGGRRGAIYAGLAALRDRYGDLVRARYPAIPRRVSGYNLDELLGERGFDVARALVGTESTCALTLEATVRLVDWPRARRLVVLGYPDVFAAGDAVPAVLEHGPIALEGLDEVLIQDMTRAGIHPAQVAMLPAGAGWLMVELGADTWDEATARAERLAAALAKDRGGAGRWPTVRIFDTPEDERRVWEVRDSALGATAHGPAGHNFEGWEDSAVHPDRIGDYLRDLRALMGSHGYRGALYGHLGHGCMHTRNNFELHTEAGLRRWRAYLDEAADLVIAYGGSLSGEHGDGQARAELYPKMFGPELVRAFEEFKALWDPGDRMNPGKLVRPYAITENLRLGPAYRPRHPGPTHFAFPADEHGFVGATTRCVGVGKCRRADGGTMCPSFMVTGEEKHSTRGRARLLFELLNGDPMTGGWRDEDVRDALDLCVSCKGCKGDCPVSVDMATYKAEFLSHYYAGRLRPRAAYAVGLIWWLARAAARAPGLVNLATRTPGLEQALKWAAGVTQHRPVPAFAEQTFRAWFARRPARPSGTGGRELLLWPDTFTNFFDPGAGRAAVEVLEGAGYRVRLPGAVLCCGRPLYDYGMLPTAKRLLGRVLDALGPDIEAGVPLVALEPSCLSVFRDELTNLFPDDRRAARLAAQSFTLAELLERTDGWVPPPLAAEAVVQGHCHQKAVVGMDAEQRLLAAMGVEARLLDAGCCGMAGPFGFEAAHYRTSMAMGERALLPAVRLASQDTLVLADGFSCATQIEHGTGRRPLHLAELLAWAASGRPPEVAEVAGVRPPGRRLAAGALAGAAAGVAVGAIWLARRSRQGLRDRRDRAGALR